ncbi:uncharacterized protein LOC107645199 [Arachis ipaensis]|uniref:Bifunctional inhibitor/plant lipid transfer protein/seed storage helical domain-containing protein n=1 Tax=Arachis hypogaea TaxID=3818 RepID=A0A444YGR6_ARAHY|nr:uncharacterized protein LOC107645199 [Arachis ipaensis]XP_025657866.1 uncharacterized protein LOC112754431 [Arachis hypogaea]RYR01106.1 hypothetical protein Ahy_B06g079955 isoform B [Arachis hypogaea]
MKMMLSSAIITTFLLMTSTMKMVDCQTQNSIACTISMMSSITPCANFITGSGNNNGGVTPPSSTCCDSLRALMSSSMDCACKVLSANAPNLQLPITQAVAISLATACNINGLSAHCKGEVVEAESAAKTP